MEQWRDVVGYEGLYQVSDLGNVRKVANGALLKLSTINEKSLCVRLAKGDKRTTYLVHRLVLIAFRGIDEDKTEVYHLNGDSQDNRLDNLVWLSHDEVMQYCIARDYRDTPQGEGHWNAKLTAEDVQNIKRLHADGYKQVELAEIYNTGTSNINAILRGRSWKALK